MRTVPGLASSTRRRTPKGDGAAANMQMLSPRLLGRQTSSELQQGRPPVSPHAEFQPTHVVLQQVERGGAT